MHEQQGIHHTGWSAASLLVVQAAAHPEAFSSCLASFARLRLPVDQAAMGLMLSR